ncbi:MAG: T9SS type A sorting domain-containing protein [Bacteroidota bacterium]
MIKTSLLLLLLIISSYIYSQPDTLWTRTFGGDESDYGECVQQTRDNGFIIAGHTKSFGDYFGDALLIKYDSEGNLTWYKTYGGDREDRISSIKETYDNGYIISGKTASFRTVWSNGWLLKTNQYGDTLWTRTYGGSKSNNFNCIITNQDSGYTTIGSTNSFGLGEWDIWVVRFDSTGGMMWENTYGGKQSEYGLFIEKTSDNGYILCGNTNSFNSQNVDIIVIKINGFGEQVWKYQDGGDGFDGCSSIIQCYDDSYVLIGYTQENVGENSNLWILKLDSLGNLIWDKTLGGDYGDYGKLIQQTYDGGYIIIGTADSNPINNHSKLWILKIDSLGNILWEKIFNKGTNDDGNYVQVIHDKGYIVLGGTLTFMGNSDIWLMRFSPDTGNVSGLEYNYLTTTSFSISQNYPNPFNPITTILYQLPKSYYVKLSIYDINGRFIESLVDEWKNAGIYSVIWDAKKVGSGIYLYSIETIDFTCTKKCVVLK